MSVKNNLHAARKKAGLTQEELAHAGNISRQAYVSIESGKSVPSTEVALRIARKLHIRVEDLFSLDDGIENLVEAELIGDPADVTSGTRMQVVQFGSRLLTRPMNEGLSVSHILNSADALAVNTHDRQVDLKMLNRTAVNTPTLILSGCDPAAFDYFRHDPGPGRAPHLARKRTVSRRCTRWPAVKFILPAAVSKTVSRVSIIYRWSRNRPVPLYDYPVCYLAAGYDGQRRKS